MIKLIGIPVDANSSFLRGPALGPDRIRLMDSEGSANRCCEDGMEIVRDKTYIDLGNIEFSSADRRLAFKEIKSLISEAIEDGSKLLSLGGDHSVTYPILEAYCNKYPSLHILHIDAHSDLYDSFDDNPYSHASPFARIMENGSISSLTQVGIRTFNQHQRDQAKKFGVQVVEMKYFTLDFLASLSGPLYISLDLDGLDPAFAPGVSHHEPGGLTSRQVLDIFSGIQVEVVGADIVEYNPTRDIHNMTAMLGYKMWKELMALMSRA